MRIGWRVAFADVPHDLCACSSSLAQIQQQQKLKIEGLPESVSEEMLKGDESFLRAFHHALLEVRHSLASVVDGGNTQPSRCCRDPDTTTLDLDFLFPLTDCCSLPETPRSRCRKVP